jgi:hypothetical protein
MTVLYNRWTVVIKLYILVYRTIFVSKKNEQKEEGDDANYKKYFDYNKSTS